MSVSVPSAGPSPVAVVIVSWNSAAYLADCLSSVLAQRRPPRQVVVVDNASSDGSAAIARRFAPRVELIEPGRNLGFCGANNLGFRRADAPFVLALNPDTRLEPDFLERLLPAMDDPRVGIAAGKLLRFDGRTVDSAGQLLGRSRQPIDRGYGRPDDGSWDGDEEVFGACGAAALYRRDMLDHLADPGPDYFDEAFFAFVEDLDLAWRARRLGWRAAYRHGAVAYHARGGSADGSPRLARVAAMLGRRPEVRFHIVKNRWLTMLRNDTASAFLLNLPWIAARDLATLALLALTSPAVLVRLWRARHLAARARRLGRLDASRPGHHVSEDRER